MTIIKSDSNANPVIRGKIYEEKTNISLVAAAVRVDNENPPFKVNSKGEFLFSIPPGTHFYQGRAVGYMVLNTKRFKANAGDTITIDYHLRMDNVDLH